MTEPIIITNDIPSADDILQALHVYIDKKFGRKERGKYINPYILKEKMTLWSISEEFVNYEPETICKLLKELIERGSIESNLDSENSYPFDAYFIPKTELIDEALYDTYISVKNVLHGE